MKRKILMVVACMAIGSTVRGAEFAPVQNRGAVEVTSMTTVAASTTPMLLVSTGTNVIDRSHPGAWSFLPTSTSNVQVFGQYMRDRIYLEIQNDTDGNIWVGYNNRVSSQPGTNYGRRISTGAVWANDGAVRDYWVVAATTTLQKIVVTQQK